MPSRSLQRRITIAYLAFALAACALFATIASVAVEGIEALLVDERLQAVVTWASPRHQAGLPVEMPNGTIFYHGDAIPPALRGMEPGVQQRIVDGVTLRMLVGRDAAGDYVVVDRESDYEKIELMVYSMVAAGLGALLVLSLVLGRYVARRIAVPVESLAVAVTGGEQVSEPELLARQDELGVLARAFAARTAELGRFLERERRFTGDVSHELRTPLTVIIGAAEILVHETASRPDLNAPAKRILRAAQDAAARVNILLLLARSPQSIDAPEMEILPLVEEEVERARPFLGDKPVSLEFEVQQPFRVRARPELLASAIGNLVRNACQYTLQGRVRVEVGNRTVTIADTGPGLPSAVQARLTGKEDAGSIPGKAGTGLGLLLARRICDHLDAAMEVSTGADGTVIKLRFPEINEILTPS